jgi:hypothetical protein
MANLILGHGVSWCFGTSLAPKESGRPGVVVASMCPVICYVCGVPLERVSEAG